MDMDDFYGAFCTGDIYPLLTAINEQFTVPLPPLIQRDAEPKPTFTMSPSPSAETSFTTPSTSTETVTELVYVYYDMTEFPAKEVNKSVLSSTSSFTKPITISTRQTSTSTQLPKSLSSSPRPLTSTAYAAFTQTTPPTAFSSFTHTTQPSMLIPPMNPITTQTPSMISVSKSQRLPLDQLVLVENIPHEKQQSAVHTGSVVTNTGFKPHTQKRVGLTIPRTISPSVSLSKPISPVQQPPKVSLQIPTGNGDQVKRQRLMNDILSFVFTSDRSGFRQGPVLQNPHKAAAQFLSRERLNPVLPNIKLDGNTNYNNHNRKSFLRISPPARTARLVLGGSSHSGNDMVRPNSKRIKTANLVIPDNLKISETLVTNTRN